MLSKEVKLFSSKKDLFHFFLFLLFILSYSLLIEYNNYKKLREFDSALTTVTVIKQYTKTKLSSKGKSKTYQVLKLKSQNEYIFYTVANKNLRDIKGKKVDLELTIKELTFYQYMTTFFAYTKILKVQENKTLKQTLNTYIENAHTNKDIISIYQALYTATPLTKELQSTFSTLGVSHLLAISGFHLGVLSGVLFFLLKYPYKFLQNRYFPYRNSTSDLFFLVLFMLFGYLLFLDSPPSLVRAFIMLVIGFLLYNRGLQVVSIQTLSLTILLILVFLPRFFFSLGFWLSVSGVFYIFLFLIHFKHLSKILQFILVPIWVYIMMLPLSLYIFKNFSLYHPLSIIWTSLFTLFYPLSIFFHSIGFGDILDNSLLWFLSLEGKGVQIGLDSYVMSGFILFSFLSIFYKRAVYILIIYSSFIFFIATKQL